MLYTPYMKIAVYAIAKNEEHFVKRWAESAKDADYLLIADTGSTDNTVAVAKELGIVCHTISVKPWRFDDARNASLALLPEDIDYCIALDLDETIVGDLRGELEKALAQGINRPTYRFITSWTSEGEPGMEFAGFRIHSRQGWRWRYPIHELPVPYGIPEKAQYFTGFRIEHHPDQTKSRGQYLPLLKMATEEDPASDRNAFYYARELYFHGMWAESIAEFKRHLSLPSAWWKPERAGAMNYLGQMDTENAIEWFDKSIIECPDRREPYVLKARYYYQKVDWENCLLWAKMALQIKEKNMEYFNEPYAWGSEPYDLAALASHNLGDNKSALEYGQKAVELSPTDERLQRNMVFYSL